MRMPRHLAAHACLACTCPHCCFVACSRLSSSIEQTSSSHLRTEPMLHTHMETSLLPLSDRAPPQNLVLSSACLMHMDLGCASIRTAVEAPLPATPGHLVYSMACLFMPWNCGHILVVTRFPMGKDGVHGEIHDNFMWERLSSSIYHLIFLWIWFIDFTNWMIMKDWSIGLHFP